jgi:microcystin degradation protein MlrC
MAEDVAWLLHTIPNGDFDELPWPARRSLAEVLNVDSEAVAVAERYWQEKGADLVNYFEALFEA